MDLNGTKIQEKVQEFYLGFPVSLKYVCQMAWQRYIGREWKTDFFSEEQKLGFHPYTLSKNGGVHFIIIIIEHAWHIFQKCKSKKKNQGTETHYRDLTSALS